MPQGGLPRQHSLDALTLREQQPEPKVIGSESMPSSDNLSQDHRDKEGRVVT